MKTAFRNNRSLPVHTAGLVLAMLMLACNLGKLPANSNEAPAPSGSGPECLKGVFPGKTTEDELPAVIGYPLIEETEGDFKYLRYRTTVYGQLNSVTLQNGVAVQVSFIQPEDQPLAWSAVKKQIGEPAHTAYSTYLQGSMVYAYPTQGRAFIADENLDIVFIQECFIPMSLEDYRTTYGDMLPSEDPFTR